jgi:hypothetical protein
MNNETEIRRFFFFPAMADFQNKNTFFDNLSFMGTLRRPGTLWLVSAAAWSLTSGITVLQLRFCEISLLDD